MDIRVDHKVCFSACLFVLFQAAGSRLAIVVTSLSTAVACTVYAFYNGWKLTLVVLSFIPFLIIANAIHMKVIYASGKGSKDGADEKLQSGKVRPYS